MENNSFCFFRIFLFLYAALLIFHIWETLAEGSWEVLAGLLVGAAIAVVAHKKHGYLPLLFLGGHLVIEWHHHGVHGNEYSLSEIIFHGIHSLFDLSFLTIETRRHCKKFSRHIITLSIALILILFFMSWFTSGSSTEHHEHNGNFLSYLVLGGILGCISSHLLNKKGA